MDFRVIYIDSMIKGDLTPAAGVTSQRWDNRTVMANYCPREVDLRPMVATAQWTYETHLLTPAPRAIRSSTSLAMVVGTIPTMGPRKTR